MVYLDLAELPSLVGRRGLIADRRYASRSFLRGDHLFDDSQPLETEVRAIIQQQTGHATRGPIRLLTQLRYLGYSFSPLNLFYVYDELDQYVEYVVAEVNNTPWNQRHCYVLWEENRSGSGAALQFSHSKDFHVSPFMEMNLDYHWRLSQPDAKLTVQLANTDSSRKLFEARMTLQRHALSRSRLRTMGVRYPWMTAHISVAIYYQALKLWWKKCPFHTNPNRPQSERHLAGNSPNASPTRPRGMSR